MERTIKNKKRSLARNNRSVIIVFQSRIAVELISSNFFEWNRDCLNFFGVFLDLHDFPWLTGRLSTKSELKVILLLIYELVSTLL